MGEKQNIKERHGHARVGKETATYSSWNMMLQRCTNPNRDKYRLYGGRGITVCRRWFKFINFLKDMGEKPTGMTLERKDTNGDYNKDNCTWATKKQQANNRRNNRVLTYKGITMNTTQWANALNMPYHVLRQRLHRKWSIEKSLTQEVRKW